MRHVFLALALAASGSFAAAAEDYQEPRYEVIEADTVIRTSLRGIAQFERGADGALLVETRADAWYRLALDAGCSFNLALDSVEIESRAGRIDKGAMVLISGRPCAIHSIDRIAAPAS